MSDQHPPASKVGLAGFVRSDVHLVVRGFVALTLLPFLLTSEIRQAAWPTVAKVSAIAAVWIVVAAGLASTAPRKSSVVAEPTEFATPAESSSPTDLPTATPTATDIPSDLPTFGPGIVVPSGEGDGDIPGHCGVERWNVKTGADADRDEVNLQSSTKTTIAYLTSLSQPSDLPSDNRVSPVETTVWTLDATLVQYKVEADSDVHLVIHDASGRSMITEIPSPSCVSDISPMRSSIAAVRDDFDARFHHGGSWDYVNEHVTIRGPGFWDFFHGQTGVAPNAIEIHPVLGMTFDGTAPAPAPTAKQTIEPGHGGSCAPSYPDECIPPPPPDLNCGDISYRRFRVIYNVPDPDPHHFDGDHDGIGCES